MIVSLITWKVSARWRRLELLAIALLACDIDLKKLGDIGDLGRWAQTFMPSESQTQPLYSRYITRSAIGGSVTKGTHHMQVAILTM